MKFSQYQKCYKKKSLSVNKNFIFQLLLFIKNQKILNLRSLIVQSSRADKLKSRITRNGRMLVIIVYINQSIRRPNRNHGRH